MHKTYRIPILISTILLVVAAIITFIIIDSSTTAMKVGKIKIRNNEYSFYCAEFIDFIGIDDSEALKVKYDSKRNYGRYYIDEIVNNIEEDNKMYLCAINEDIKLTDEDKTQIDDKVSQTFEKYEKYGISKSTIKKVLTKRSYIDKLYSTVNIETTKDQVTYSKTYCLLFRTNELDSDGFVKTDANGKMVYVSETEKEEIYSKAQEALLDIRNGMSMEDAANKYGVLSDSGYIYGNKDTYEGKYYEAISRLSEGQISNVVEIQYGYAIIEMTDEEDEEYKADIDGNASETLREKALDEAKTTWLDKLNKSTDLELKNKLYEIDLTQFF